VPFTGKHLAFTIPMIADELRERTRRFAIDVIGLCLRLPPNDLTRLVRPQLLRAASGVAANYRAACRSRSRREFVSRLATVIEETDESELWLDMLQHHACGPLEVVASLRSESIELRSILARSRATALANLRRRKGNEGMVGMTGMRE
jgi:four helix bundle protein